MQLRDRRGTTKVGPWLQCVLRGQNPLFAGHLCICDRVDIKAVEQFVFYGKRDLYSAVKCGERRHFRS
jgi:hypothetical protein